MEKDEVIELAKGSKTDEREKQVMSRGHHISSIGMAMALLLIMILRYIKGDLFSQDLLLIMMAQVSTLSIYQYIKLKEKLYLFMFGVGLVAIVLALINVLTEYGYF
jgi:Na+-transporting methylmalonyl-CoA/oxaloacetate decarboxylase gamma subunit